MLGHEKSSEGRGWRVPRGASPPLATAAKPSGHCWGGSSSQQLSTSAAPFSSGVNYASALRQGTRSSGRPTSLWDATEPSKTADADVGVARQEQASGAKLKTPMAWSSHSQHDGRPTSDRREDSARTSQPAAHRSRSPSNVGLPSKTAPDKHAGSQGDGFEEVSHRRRKKDKQEQPPLASAPAAKNASAPAVAAVKEAAPPGKTSAKSSAKPPKSGKSRQGSANASSQPQSHSTATTTVKPKFGKAATLDFSQYISKPAAPAAIQVRGKDPIQIRRAPGGSHSSSQQAIAGPPSSSQHASGQARRAPVASVPSSQSGASAWPSVAAAPRPAWPVTKAANPSTDTQIVVRREQDKLQSSRGGPQSGKAARLAFPSKQQVAVPRNALDSTAPVVRRGKEREGGKKKKPTILKKTILEERASRREARAAATASASGGVELETIVRTEVADSDDPATHDDDVTAGSADEAIESEGSDVEQQFSTAGAVETLDSGDADGPAAAEVRVHQGSSAATELVKADRVSGDDEIGEDERADDTPNSNPDGCMPKAAKLHSRRFREYCTHMRDRQIDSVVIVLLERIVFFQDRLHRENPIKAKYRKRYVVGLREVRKHVVARKIKCVVLSPAVEKIANPGGLDDKITEILQHCQEQEVPVVFALTRRKLGSVMRRKTPASIVGIFNYDGAQDHFHQLMSLVKEARDLYVAAQMLASISGGKEEDVVSAEAEDTGGVECESVTNPEDVACAEASGVTSARTEYFATHAT